MLVSLPPSKASRFVCAGQIVTVSTKSTENIFDVMTAAWNCPFDSDQVLVVLDKGHTTTKNIIETKKFVLSIVSKEHLNSILKVGSQHGRDVGDKFSWADLEYDVTEKLGLHVLKDVLAYIECELSEPEVLEKTGVCIGKAINIKVKEGLYNEDTDSFIEGAKQTIRYVSNTEFVTGGTKL